MTSRQEAALHCALPRNDFNQEDLDSMHREFHVLCLGLAAPGYESMIADLLPADFKIAFSEVGNAGLEEALRNTDFLLIGGVPVSEQVFEVAPRLRLVQIFGAGYDKVDLAAARRRGIHIANSGGGNAVSVAELTIALVLALYRQLVRSHLGVKAGRWTPALEYEIVGEGIHELSGKTLGLVGLGAIASAVAGISRGFGLRVLYYARRHRSSAEEERLGVSYSSLDDLLRRVDILSLHVPLTSETRGMIGRRELGLLKPEAVLINTCRGAVVDEGALIEFLKDGRIRGAGLDVFAEEPISADSPFLSLENVVLSPHLGGEAREAALKTFSVCCENITRVAAGEKPSRLVPIP